MSKFESEFESKFESESESESTCCPECWHAHTTENGGLVHASQHGHLECFETIHQLFISQQSPLPFEYLITDTAAKYGHVSILQSAHARNIVWGEFTCANAFAYGHLDCLRFAHESGCVWGDNTWHYWYTVDIEHSPACVAYAHTHHCPYVSSPFESPEPTPSPQPHHLHPALAPQQPYPYPHAFVRRQWSPNIESNSFS